MAQTGTRVSGIGGEAHVILLSFGSDPERTKESLLRTEAAAAAHHRLVKPAPAVNLHNLICVGTMAMIRSCSREIALLWPPCPNTKPTPASVCQTDPSLLFRGARTGRRQFDLSGSLYMTNGMGCIQQSWSIKFSNSFVVISPKIIKTNMEKRLAKQKMLVDGKVQNGQDDMCGWSEERSTERQSSDLDHQNGEVEKQILSAPSLAKD